jgi:hypothetical protein
MCISIQDSFEIVDVPCQRKEIAAHESGGVVYFMGHTGCQRSNGG